MWHTRPTPAVLHERSACFSSSLPLMWSCHDAPSNAQSLQTSSLPGKDHQPRRLAVFSLCATKCRVGMTRVLGLSSAGPEPLGRSAQGMQPGGERAAPERYGCGAMQAVKKPGLAEGPQGEKTKRQ